MITYHVVVSFGRDDEGNIVPLEPKEVPNSAVAKSRARGEAIKAGQVGAIAFSRSGDPNIGEFKPAEMIASYGEVDLATLEG